MYLVGMAKGSEGNDLGCLPAALNKILHSSIYWGRVETSLWTGQAALKSF